MKNFDAPEIQVIMFAEFDENKVLTNFLSSDETEIQSLENGMQIEF